MEIILKRLYKLNEYQKVFLTHKIFDYWLKGNIKNKSKLFLPKDLKIYNSKEVSKVFLICSRIEKDSEVEKMFNDFKKIKFGDKLKFMIALFNYINSLEIVPTYITHNLNFKDLSEKILQYQTNS